MTAHDVDVVIAGSGVAGSLLASRLAEAGHSVLILEGGPTRERGTLVSSQIWSRRLKWGGPAIATSGDAPLSVGFGAGWGTGGAGMHHYACWFRLHEEDFEMKQRFGVGLDWPLGYTDLQPWYDEVQADVGIAGDAAAEIWRPAGAAYPMPPLPAFRQGELIAAGFKSLGQRTAPLPMAINSVPYKGRPACIFDGWCDAGCPTGALANPVVTWLASAQRAGASLRNGCHVTRVLTNPAGDHATGVEFRGPDGKLVTANAKVVILAAYTFEIPRILFNSREGGLANGSDALGRYMMAHSTLSMFGLFDERTDNHLGMTGGHLVAQDRYAKDPALGFTASRQWLIGNALKPNDLLGIGNARVDLFGPALHAFMKDAAHHLGVMTFVGEGLPQADNRVTLDEARDAHGLPLARVQHSFAADSVKCWEAGAAEGLQVMKAAGAREAWHGPRAQMHTLGGAIMGHSSKDSVTNGFGQTHEVPNLFVAGSSLFPTSGGVNPTFTVGALAARSADYIHRAWSTLSG